MQLKAINSAVNKNVSKMTNNVKAANYGVDTKFLELSKKSSMLLKEMNEIEAKISSKVQSYQYVGWKQQSAVKDEIKQLKMLLQQREIEYKQSIQNSIDYWMKHGNGKTLLGEKFLEG